MKDESTLTTLWLALAHWGHAFGNWVQAVAPEFLLTTRGVCHLLIFIFIVGYRKKTDHHRKVVGLVAGIIAGASLAEAYRIIVNYGAFLLNVQVPLTVFVAGILFFVMYAKGNMARFIPKRFDRASR